MLKRWTVHVEWHRGYRPRLSIRPAPQAGDVIEDGGQRVRLERCEQCSGDGLMARPLVELVTTAAHTAPQPVDGPVHSPGGAVRSDPILGRCDDHPTCPVLRIQWSGLLGRGPLEFPVEWRSITYTCGCVRRPMLGA